MQPPPAGVAINGHGRSRTDAAVWITDSDPAEFRERSRYQMALCDWSVAVSALYTTGEDLYKIQNCIANMRVKNLLNPLIYHKKSSVLFYRHSVNVCNCTRFIFHAEFVHLHLQTQDLRFQSSVLLLGAVCTTFTCDVLLSLCKHQYLLRVEIFLNSCQLVPLA